MRAPTLTGCAGAPASEFWGAQPWQGGANSSAGAAGAERITGQVQWSHKLLKSPLSLEMGEEKPSPLQEEPSALRLIAAG